MAGVSLAGPRLSVKRLNAHALHQRAHMFAASNLSCPIELVAQHACTHEWVLQVQYVNATHERQIGSADRFGQIIHAASANA